MKAYELQTARLEISVRDTLDDSMQLVIRSYSFTEVLYK